MPKDVGEDAVALGIALTADDFRIALGFRRDLDHLAIGDSPTPLALFGALRARRLGLGETLGPHAAISLRRHLLSRGRSGGYARPGY